MKLPLIPEDSIIAKLKPLFKKVAKTDLETPDLFDFYFYLK